MVDYLKEINEKYINQNTDDKENLEKYQLIGQILDEEKCFMKMPIETAYGILRDLNVPEDQIKNVYLTIIDETMKSFGNE